MRVPSGWTLITQNIFWGKAVIIANIPSESMHFLSWSAQVFKSCIHLNLMIGLFAIDEYMNKYVYGTLHDTLSIVINYHLLILYLPLINIPASLLLALINVRTHLWGNRSKDWWIRCILHQNRKISISVQLPSEIICIPYSELNISMRIQSEGTLMRISIHVTIIVWYSHLVSIVLLLR